ncbi:ferrous iron transport protein B [Megasphaera elsdenii]|uniref:ferrous iron transport protein B n=1 Tax=Megasphaera elsdenii TaxID=907 RepID=UPI001D02D1EA|nr:ferrous iron transport protein B [Megasphaera elsdenii]MCB5703366.1 ferrous iron transport protein B [Megasphaera elsdenii]MCB5728152.1 ferrous iron transport protein B [Megasphaera elsdenii]MCB5771899.1 ferrous iron transport protein B [Megasphaera elsdenii]
MENAAKIKIALAGNPNCGKTTIFNNITGAKQHVGNYPGVTVEKKEGHRTFNGKDLLFVDLPGTYSLTARSLDEVVARNVIINEKPDIIVNVLDASNLERNLYLAAQLVELGRPMVIALNMMDIADRMGIKIDLKKLGKQLGAVVVPLVGSKNIGTKELLDAISGTQTQNLVNAKVDYGPDVEPAIANLTDAIEKMGIIKYPVRWLAVKLLENDSDAIAKVRAMEGTNSILALASTLRDSLANKIDLDFYFAQCRYQFATDAFNKSIINVGSSDSLSDKIDSVLTHRYLGIPIFLALMWLMFVVVINVGAYPQGWLDTGFSMLGDWCSDVIEDDQLRSLVVDGVIGGVGSVLSFVPLIVLLYLFISLLEDTGYMARAAFLIDRAMRALGLHGKSFIPMILGFGCNVPGIMAARTLDNEKDRLVTILACPFMSCGARLPVYTLLIAAFFGASGHGGTVLFGVYLLGIIISVCVALVLRHTTFKGEQEPFVMEMPPYHIPTLKGVLMHMWERTVLYLKKAGTFILGASILVWFLTAYPMDVDYSQDFDAAKDQVTAEMEQKQADILQSYGLSAIEDNDELNTMYESMVAAADEAADEEDEDEADTGNALNPAAALSSVEDQVKNSEEEDNLFMGKYPQSFADLQEQNPAVFAQALPLFDAKADADDESSKLDDQQTAEKLQQSYAARLGKFVEPVIAPLGFDWKIGVGLIACTAAKEVMVSTLGTIYSVGGDDTHESGIVAYLRDDPDFNQAVALSLMVFTLLYMPCVAAMAVIKRETGSWKMLLACDAMCLVLSYVLAFITYHLALMAGLGA